MGLESAHGSMARSAAFAASDLKFQLFRRGRVSRGLCEAFLDLIFGKCAEFRRLSEPKQRPAVPLAKAGEISPERARRRRAERRLSPHP